MDLEDDFLKSIRRYSCIWNASLASYRCMEAKECAWRKIVEETGLSDVKTAKEKWDKIIGSFREDLKREYDRIEEVINCIHKYKPYMINPQKRFDELKKKSEEYVPCSLSSTEISSKGDKNRTTSTTPKSHGVKRNASILDAKIEHTKRTRSHSEDSLEKFFLKIAEDTRKLPTHLQRRIRRNVFNDVKNAENKALERNLDKLYKAENIRNDDKEHD